MSNLLWVKMPSHWITAGQLSKDFSSKVISEDIAALKIYICLCLYAEIVHRKKSHSYCEPTHNLKIPEITVEQFESNLTYDQISESTCLSRLMVSNGLKKLVATNLVQKQGTTRKIIYVITGSTGRAWCKLPKRELVKKDNIISSFSPFKQRYKHERDALKFFLYLLSVRTNSKQYVDLSRGTISLKTGITISELDGALGFLKGIGLLKDVKNLGYLARTKNTTRLERDRLHRYWVTGSESLNLKRVYTDSYDEPI
jgi:hypothetical protein